jgi:predicted small lipoprotein YifL
MIRLTAAIVLIALLLGACGQKGPLVLPEEAKRKQAPPAVIDVPSTQEQNR